MLSFPILKLNSEIPTAVGGIFSTEDGVNNLVSSFNWFPISVRSIEERERFLYGVGDMLPALLGELCRSMGDPKLILLLPAGGTTIFSFCHNFPALSISLILPNAAATRPEKPCC